MRAIIAAGVSVIAGPETISTSRPEHPAELQGFPFCHEAHAVSKRTLWCWYDTNCAPIQPRTGAESVGVGLTRPARYLTRGAKGTDVGRCGVAVGSSRTSVAVGGAAAAVARSPSPQTSVNTIPASVLMT